MKHRIVFCALMLLSAAGCETRCRTYCENLYFRVLSCHIPTQEGPQQFINNCETSVEKVGFTGEHCSIAWQNLSRLNCAAFHSAITGD